MGANTALRLEPGALAVVRREEHRDRVAGIGALDGLNRDLAVKLLAAGDLCVADVLNEFAAGLALEGLDVPGGDGGGRREDERDDGEAHCGRI